ncbi:MAG TPA: hypothetical protein PKZ97_18855, partial [Azospirillaceae bacterium]|nr:hypothetical protein [Azospirillaceae bacterium]
LAALGKRDALLRAATEGIRQPVANLRAALEILVDTPELGPEERDAFQSGMTEAVELLNAQLERVTDEYRSLAAASWPMSDIHSGNLFNLVRRRVGGDKGYGVAPVGLPQWVHVDSYSMVVMLDYLIDYVYSLTGVQAFDICAEQDGHWLYLDILWQGPKVPSAIIDTWLDHPLPDALGGLTVGDVLTHHRSTLWSEPACACRFPRPRPRRRRVPPRWRPRRGRSFSTSNCCTSRWRRRNWGARRWINCITWCSTPKPPACRRPAATRSFRSPRCASSTAAF